MGTPERARVLRRSILRRESLRRCLEGGPARRGVLPRRALLLPRARLRDAARPPAVETIPASASRSRISASLVRRLRRQSAFSIQLSWKASPRAGSFIKKNQGSNTQNLLQTSATYEDLRQFSWISSNSIIFFARSGRMTPKKTMKRGNGRIFHFSFFQQS